MALPPSIRILATAAALGGAVPNGAAESTEPLWHELSVPGGVPALARAAGLDPRTPPARLVPEIARRVHAPYGERAGTRRAPEMLSAYLRGRPAAPEAAPALAPSTVGVVIVQGDDDGRAPSGPVREPAPATEVPTPLAPGALPLPLSPELWTRAVFRGQVAPGELARAIVTDPQAALLYRGLAALDEPTLRAIGDADTVEALYRQHAEVFSIVAPGFRVAEARVVVPGGYEAAAAWQAVVGASILEPAPFLLSLLDREEGRIALLFHALGQVDPGRQRWALGLDTKPADPKAVPARLKELRDRTCRAQHLWWRGERGPFSRPPVDPARVLTALRLAPDGRIVGPSGRAFWDAAFADEGSPAAVKDDEPIDAPWLLERLSTTPPDLAQRRIDTLRFVQRRFPNAPGASLGEVVEAARGFVRYRALALVLERIGVDDPTLYAAASHRAGQVSSIADGRRAHVGLAQFQGALAVVDGARLARVLDAPTALRLVRELVAVDFQQERYDGRIADWMSARLVPALRDATGALESDDAEAVVIRAIAGARRGAGAAPQVTWEGLEYAVDVPAAEDARMRAVRLRQPGARLADALARRDDPALAEALIGLAYAARLPHPDTPLVGDVAGRHDFGGRDEEAAGGLSAWSVPREVSGTDVRWHVRGSLLALDVGLAARRLRRAHAEPPLEVPRLNVADRQSFAEAAALLNPATLTDDGRDAIAAALARGRERARRAAVDPDERRRLLGLFGRRAGRRTEIARITEQGLESLPEALTLGELFELGREGPDGTRVRGDDDLEAWGTPALRDEASLALRLPRSDAHDDLTGRRGDGRLGATLPDLNLRVAESLAEMDLPARLAPSILAFAVQDLIDEVQPAYLEDASAIARYARDLPRMRIEDYVSSLVGGGPLVPLEGR